MIIRTFLRRPGITFLQHFKNGILSERLAIGDEPFLVLQWIQQLSCAVACLESHGYAHSDICINPRNILVDENDQLKLADFHHTLLIGENLDVGYEPYLPRFYVGLWKSGSVGGGCYGVAGPITEQQ